MTIEPGSKQHDEADLNNHVPVTDPSEIDAKLSAKKRRLNGKSEKDNDAEINTFHVVPLHPFGVQPAGNALLKDASSLMQHNRAIHSSMGLFASLPDGLLLQLLSFCGPKELARLQSTSRTMQAFAAHEPLWREALLARTGGRLTSWQGTWKATLSHHINHSLQKQLLDQHHSGPSKIPCTVYSDDMFLPLQLASLPLGRYVPSKQRQRDPYKRIERVDMSTLTKAEFLQEYAEQSKPCLLTDIKGQTDDQTPRWTIEDVRQMYTTRRIRAEALSMPMNAYAAYARTCQTWEECRAGWIPDESPFYLFDPMLARTMQRQGRFVVPKLFRQDESDESVENIGLMASEWDLFGLLHDRRPDNAWIIAGPQRSGSGWHVDPNHTSAYNTVLSGRKLWMLLPPHITPPGVFVSQDGATVTAPLSIAEWLTDFWRACVERHGTRGNGDATLQVDICEPGETIYVPAGWKHLVVNLEESVAFTQNFVTPAELAAVLDFLKNTPDQISGFRMRRQQQQQQQQQRRKHDTTQACVDEQESDSDPEFDELPNDGMEEKQKLFDLFVERLKSFDQNLCEKGLEGMRKLEAKRGASNASGAANNPHRLRKSGQTTAQDATQSWWQSLKASHNKERANDGEAGASNMFANHLDQAEELDDVPW